MIDDSLLKLEERAVYLLRGLYHKYGYSPYRMSKFEEYDLYVQNKDFLVSDRIITFNDTNGRLLALKPDVTLSIVKNYDGKPGCKQKVYYSENVYRVSGATKQFKEIMQAGLECFGDIDLYDIYEAISLAAESLALISPDFALDISQMDLLSTLLNEAGADERSRREILRCIAEKNAHDLRRVCERYGLGSACAQRLCACIDIYGDRRDALRRLESVCVTAQSAAALDQLKRLDALLSLSRFSDRIRFDFSLVNDMSYYNGVVFKGYLNGIAESVLSGGQYDKLLERMGKNGGAVGFAVYLDLLDQLRPRRSGCDIDVLVLYDESTDTAALADKVGELVSAGKRVSAQKAIPDRMRWGEMMDLRKEAAR